MFVDSIGKVEFMNTYGSAGTDAIAATAGVDMAGYEGVVFLARMATPNAGNYISVAQSDDLSGSPDGYSDLLASKVTTGTADEVVFCEVYRPTKRYLLPTITRGASTTVEGFIAIRYGAKKLPITNTVAGTSIAEVHISPDEGTA